MGEETLSMREQVEDAWAQFEEEDVTAPETEASPEVVEAVSKPDETPVAEQQEEEKPAAEVKPDESKPEPEETEPDKKTEEKAPHSWSPANREQWGKLPAEVKAQITKRETEIEKAMRNTADSRRVAQQLAQTVEPYRQSMMAAGYRDPFQAIDTLFRAEATLRGGTQAEKARQVVDLIKQYGVDVQTLDAALTGQAPTQQQPGNDIEQLLEQKLAPFQQFITAQQQREQMAKQAEVEKAKQAVQQFEGEFLSDVRMDMADIMDLAHKNGRPMTIQEAYDRACALHPEISKVIAQREEQKRLMGTTAAVEKKKTAANASLTGRQGGNPAPTGNESLRDVLENAWNDQVG